MLDHTKPQASLQHDGLVRTTNVKWDRPTRIEIAELNFFLNCGKRYVNDGLAKLQTLWDLQAMPDRKSQFDACKRTSAHGHCGRQTAPRLL